MALKSYKFSDVPAEIWHGDALRFLTTLQAESVDLLVTSPPYCIGKAYDISRSSAGFRAEIERVMPEILRVLKPGGNLCWQVGNHVDGSSILPLDAVIISMLEGEQDLYLRNRIIWTFGHGTHATKRFSGRHETVVWYSKGKNAYFDLDAVRVPQKYPGKRHYKGPSIGELSGNPLGKNPGDVWDIPNVKAKHVEKTEHPCQFPIALAKRLILALSPPGGLVVDPYVGSGTTAIAALLSSRSFKGSEKEANYVEICETRIKDLIFGEPKVREDKPVRTPLENEAVSRMPSHFGNPNWVGATS
jgi:adenine-specific DNA-methyltransferase